MSVFRQGYTRPLPVGAEIFEEEGRRMAAWMQRGKRRTAPLVEKSGCPPRIRCQSRVFVASYRTASGRRVLRSTGCRYRENAEAWLSRRILDEEREKAGWLQSMSALPPVKPETAPSTPKAKNGKERLKVQKNSERAAPKQEEGQKEPWLVALTGEPFLGLLRLIRRGMILEASARESVLNAMAAHHVAQLTFLKNGDPDVELNRSIGGLNRDQKYLDAVVSARRALKDDILGRIWAALEKEAALLQAEEITPGTPGNNHNND